MEAGHIKVAKALLEAGADASAQDSAAARRYLWEHEHPVGLYAQRASWRKMAPLMGGLGQTGMCNCDVCFVSNCGSGHLRCVMGCDWDICGDICGRVRHALLLLQPLPPPGHYT